MSNFEVAHEYGLDELQLSDCPKNPMVLLKHWLEEAKGKGIKDYNGMVLSTCMGNRPNSRVVLYKKIESDSLIFFTHYGSPKAREIEMNPHVHLLFFWSNLERQIRLEGICKKIESTLSDAYFSQRNRDSQVASVISQQSLTLLSREHLEKLMEKEKNEIGELDVKRPDYWGGYRVKLKVFEFWQGRKNRLNDRVKYEQIKGRWKKQLLYP